MSHRRAECSAAVPATAGRRPSPKLHAIAMQAVPPGGAEQQNERADPRQVMWEIHSGIGAPLFW
jgi:hypothetical protein